MLYTSVYAELIDPTAPSNYVAEARVLSKTSTGIQTYTLHAILVSNDKKIAIINDSIVKVGDVVGDNKVKSIEADKVTLIGSRGESELKLFENSMKEPAK